MSFAVISKCRRTTIPQPNVSPAEARRRARLRLGSDRAVVERVRDQEFATFIESWYRDLRLAFGRSARARSFALLRF